MLESHDDIKRLGASDGIEVITLDDLKLPPATTLDLFDFDKK
jgi:hypothetical protein